MSQFAGAVGGVAEHGQITVLLVGEEVLGDCGLVVFHACADGEGDLGQHAGLRLERGVGPEAFLVAGAVLVNVPDFGIDGGDQTVVGGATGDLPPAVAALRRFDVLSGDQGQQPEGVGGPLAELLVGQVVPGDLRLARVGVVVGGASLGSGLFDGRDLADHLRIEAMS